MTGTINKEVSLDTSKLIDVKDKTVLIVGGTKGLGRAIGENLVIKGAKVTVVGRSFDGDKEKMTFLPSDLSSMKAAKKLAEEVDADFDIVLLTTGIIAGYERQESAEGVEMDMAVSYLSRLVFLKYYVPRVEKKKVRFFVMGFPGSHLKTFNLEDLNAEKKYEGGMGFVHANTIIGNEALVLHWSTVGSEHIFCGLNPGMVKTGIRSNVYKNWFMSLLGPVLEAMIACFGSTPDVYAKSIIGGILAQDVANGMLLNPEAKVILPSKCFKEDKELAHKFVSESEKLVKEKAGV